MEMPTLRRMFHTLVPPSPCIDENAKRGSFGRWRCLLCGGCSTLWSRARSSRAAGFGRSSAKGDDAERRGGVLPFSHALLRGVGHASLLVALCPRTLQDRCL